MWLFGNKKESVISAGTLAGMTDWHSHILPGVDDGVKTMEEALEILADYEANGVKHVWLTPHIMEDMPNTTSELRQRFEELCDAYKGDITLHLASENMLDNLFLERLESNDLLPIGNKGKHLLIETSYAQPPFGMEEIIDKVMAKGYIPVLAHPERYIYMSEKDYRHYLTKGIVFQLNIFSTIGLYGETAKKKAGLLLEMNRPENALHLELPETTGIENENRGDGAISFIGSDIHSRRQLAKLREQILPKDLAKGLQAVNAARV